MLFKIIVNRTMITDFRSGETQGNVLKTFNLRMVSEERILKVTPFVMRMQFKTILRLFKKT